MGERDPRGPQFLKNPWEHPAFPLHHQDKEGTALPLSRQECFLSMAFPGELLEEIGRGLQAALVEPFIEENQGRQLFLPGEQGWDVLPCALTTTPVPGEPLCYKGALPTCIALAQCIQPHVEENSPLEGEIILAGTGKSRVIRALRLSQPFYKRQAQHLGRSCRGMKLSSPNPSCGKPCECAISKGTSAPCSPFPTVRPWQAGIQGCSSPELWAGKCSPSPEPPKAPFAGTFPSFAAHSLTPDLSPGLQELDGGPAQSIPEQPLTRFGHYCPGLCANQ